MKMPLMALGLPSSRMSKADPTAGVTWEIVKWSWPLRLTVPVGAVVMLPISGAVLVPPICTVSEPLLDCTKFPVTVSVLPGPRMSWPESVKFPAVVKD